MTNLKKKRQGRTRLSIDLPDYIYDVLSKQSQTRNMTKTKIVIRAIVYYFQNYYIDSKN